MTEWKEYKLGEIVQSISDTYKFVDNEKVVFLNTSDILNGKFLNDCLVSAATLPEQAKKKIQKGDILFSEIRPANKRFAIVDFEISNYVVSTKLMVLRCNEQIYNKFLYIYLTSYEVLEYLQMIAEDRSGTFPQITFDNIDKGNYITPSLSTISVDWYDYGIQVGNLAIEILKGKKDKKYINVDSVLIDRESG